MKRFAEVTDEYVLPDGSEFERWEMPISAGPLDSKTLPDTSITVDPRETA
ncbi:MAG: hypothetical protein ACLFVU_07375 [Phycisphaerae bacterium]